MVIFRAYLRIKVAEILTLKLINGEEINLF